MLYPSHFEQKIAFDKIRSLIKTKCISVFGEEQVDEMCFSSDIAAISPLLAQTAEMLYLLTQEKEEFPLLTFYDLREGLARIKIEGLFLDAHEIFDLRRSLEVLNNVVQFIASKDNELYPELKKLLISHQSTVESQQSLDNKQLSTFDFRLSTNNFIVQIDKIITKFGKIKDNASPDLARIRKEIFQVQGSVSRSLHAILRQAQTDGLVEKDAQPTLRDGRLVIPVPPAYKRRLRGIVHDESATGKTVYIEPAEVVEANNRLRELEAEERREIMRILINFANFLRPHLDELHNYYAFLAKIDFIRAKALFAIDIKAIKPALVNQCLLEWHKALHPLLFLSLKKQGKEIIPLTVTLHEKQRILLISGPNAGGKSVCLKTVGLLQYMLQCGLLVPLHESSRMGIFENLFIDIGDEQSIENDLSTYSSHLTNMKFFVKNSDTKTLLLIDEFGGGTEPQIGGAIAEALLQRFNENKSFGIITTHYTRLKHFAEDAEGIVNGAMLYDRHLMQPLFQLEIGHAGSSFAVEIARKIGLPENVISEATHKIGSEHIDYDKHLQDIVRDKRYWEKKRQQIRLREKQLEELLGKYESDLQAINNQKKEIIKQAKAEAKAILENTNAKVENTIREIKEAQAEREKTRIIRHELQQFKQNLNEETAENDPIAQKIARLKAKQERKRRVAARHDPTNETPAPTVGSRHATTLQTGDMVRIKGQNVVGELLSIQGKTGIVGLGNLKSTVELKNLEKIVGSRHATTLQKKEKRQTAILGSTTSEEIRKRKLAFTPELDLRGQRVDEALQTVMIFMDDALMTNASRVRILHGTGTGALREVVRQYLSTVHGVVSFRDEHVQLGGAGITVVDL